MSTHYCRSEAELKTIVQTHWPNAKPFLVYVASDGQWVLVLQPSEIAPYGDAMKYWLSK